MKPHKYIRHTSTARSRQLYQYRREMPLWLAGQHFCARCGSYVIIFRRTCHHRFGRRGRLLNWKPGWAMVDFDCHIWIDNHPEAARELGLLGPMGTFNDFNRAVAHYEANK